MVKYHEKCENSKKNFKKTQIKTIKNNKTIKWPKNRLKIIKKYKKRSDNGQTDRHSEL